MARFGTSRHDPQPAQDTQTVARVRGALEGYYTREGAGAMVSVAHVLDLINPRGMWSLDPQFGKPATAALGPLGPVQEEPAPGTDPMTGCLPVTAPGT